MTPVRINGQPVDEYVAFRVFKQTRTEANVTTYEVVNRLREGAGSKVVAIFDNEDEADEYRDGLRIAHIAQLTREVR
jgi:hypothetical protein